MNNKIKYNYLKMKKKIKYNYLIMKNKNKYLKDINICIELGIINMILNI